MTKTLTLLADTIAAHPHYVAIVLALSIFFAALHTSLAHLGSGFYARSHRRTQRSLRRNTQPVFNHITIRLPEPHLCIDCGAVLPENETLCERCRLIDAYGNDLVSLWKEGR